MSLISSIYIILFLKLDPSLAKDTYSLITIKKLMIKLENETKVDKSFCLII